jgi:hypothetical protein
MKVKSVQFNIEFYTPVDLEDNGSNPLNKVYDALEVLQKLGIVADFNMSSCESAEQEIPADAFGDSKSAIVRKWAKENGIAHVDIKLIKLAELIDDMFGGKVK